MVGIADEMQAPETGRRRSAALPTSRPLLQVRKGKAEYKHLRATLSEAMKSALPRDVDCGSSSTSHMHGINFRCTQRRAAQVCRAHYVRVETPVSSYPPRPRSPGWWRAAVGSLAARQRPCWPRYAACRCVCGAKPSDPHHGPLLPTQPRAEQRKLTEAGPLCEGL